MDTSLQHATTTEEGLEAEAYHEVAEEEHHHIHLPNPSLWPLILGAAILLTIIGLMFIPDNPWLALLGIPCMLIGIMGWALEDPMAPKGGEVEQKREEGPFSPQDREVLDRARAIAEDIVTVSSTAYSAHPVRVEIEGPGVLALYGKVELEAQRRELEDALRELPGVIDVKNYIVAEDEILNIANQRLANLQAQGKLQGARNLSILVENYILNLFGEVPTSDMKYMLEREMIGIPGVRVVVNQIGVNKDIPGMVGRTRNKI
jgi:hypothetical protein